MNEVLIFAKGCVVASGDKQRLSTRSCNWCKITLSASFDSIYVAPVPQQCSSWWSRYWTLTVKKCKRRAFLFSFESQIFRTDFFQYWHLNPLSLILIFGNFGIFRTNLFLHWYLSPLSLLRWFQSGRKASIPVQFSRGETWTSTEAYFLLPSKVFVEEMRRKKGFFFSQFCFFSRGTGCREKCDNPIKPIEPGIKANKAWVRGFGNKNQVWKVLE